jgi:hypothetical protein
MRAQADLGRKLATVLPKGAQLYPCAHHSWSGILNETAHVTCVKVSMSDRNKDANRLAEQFVGDVTEHGLNAIAGEIDTAGLVNDDYRIGVFLHEPMEMRFAHLSNLAFDVAEPTRPIKFGLFDRNADLLCRSDERFPSHEATFAPADHKIRILEGENPRARSLQMAPIRNDCTNR